MTRPKATADLREEIRAAMNPSPETPPTVGDTAGFDEARFMAGYIAAIRADDDENTFRLAGILQFRPNVVELHQIALKEHAELSESAAKLEKCEAAIEAQERIKKAIDLIENPRDLEEATRLQTQIEENRKNLRAAENARNAASMAKTKLKCLTEWGGPLFGCPENPRGVTIYSGMTTADACDRLGIASGDPFAWRGGAPRQDAKSPRRRIVAAFSSAK